MAPSAPPASWRTPRLGRARIAAEIAAYERELRRTLVPVEDLFADEGGTG